MDRGTVYASKEAIYAHHVLQRKIHNQRNPLCLVNYLERYYNSTVTHATPFEFTCLGMLEEDKELDQAIKELAKASTEERKQYINGVLENNERLTDLMEGGFNSKEYGPLKMALGKKSYSKLDTILKLSGNIENKKDIAKKVLISPHNFTRDMKVLARLEPINYLEFQTEAITRGGKSSIDLVLDQLIQNGILNIEVKGDEGVMELLQKELNKLDINEGKRFKIYKAKDIKPYLHIVNSRTKKVIQENGKEGKDRYYTIKGKITTQVIEDRYNISLRGREF